MTNMYIQLLGTFAVRVDHEPITSINTPRLQSLLAYLVLHRHAPQSRQQLAFLFWPDSSEAQARTNLRKQLLYLRRALPHEETLLQIDAHTVQCHPAAQIRVDATDFAQMVAHATSAMAATEAEALTALHEAMDLYRGDLLPDCYDDWILPQREALREQYIAALERLVQWHEEQREYAAAIEYGNRLLRRDPLHEATYRRLMRLHARNGNRAAALRLYHTCVALLEKELGVPPQPDTEAAHQRILNQEIPDILRQRPPAERTTVAPFVGRQSEWQQLQRIWQKAARGSPRFALIAGEAGLGKTRLAEELLDWAQHQNSATARTRSYAAEGSLAHAPAVEWLRADALAAPLRHLEDVWLSELARLLPELRTERSDLPLPEPVLHEWQRHHLFEALARAVLAADDPLLLVIDDLQWCDRETLEWLHFLLRFDPQARLLIVGTVRMGEVTADHPLMSLLMELRNSRQLFELHLSPLDAEQTQTLAQQMTGEELAPAAATQLYRDTEGNPLFVVETVRAAERSLETGDSGQPANLQSPVTDLQSLPPKIQSVIESRLAQLSARARTVANLTAVIGREFTFEVLAAACAFAEDDLVRTLDELWQRRIICEQGINTYDFSHDKIREVAYGGVSPTYRRLFHRRVAEALETVHAAARDAVSGQLAMHYERAGRAERAIQSYERAAQVARQIHANHEAIHLLERGLALLETLSPSPEIVRQELRMQVELASALMDTKGWASPEAEQAYARAFALCQQVEKTERLFPVLWGLHEVYLFQAKRDQAWALAQQCLELAQRTRDPDLLLQGHHAVMGVAFLLSFDELPLALQHARCGMDLYEAECHHAHVFHYGGHDPGLCCLQIAAKVLWLLGYPTQALHKGQEAVALAHELSHPSSLPFALRNISDVHVYRREVDTVAELIEQTVAAAVEQTNLLQLSQAKVIQGWVLAERGELAAGIAHMRQGIAEWKDLGLMLQHPYHLALLAEAHGKAGQIDEGLRALDEALAVAHQSGERYYEAELHRLRGEFLLAGGEEPQAEGCFQRALDVARRQHARSLELRAATSLSRLWAEQGKHEEAHQLLSGIYNWFSEGFDTADLKEAQALLDALA